MTFPSTQITSPPQAQAEVIVNEAFETLQHQALYGKRHAATAGLTWGYYGGRWNGTLIADGTLTLTNAATNYIVVEISTGAISVSTSSANWSDTANYGRVYLVTTAGGVVTAVEDHRIGGISSSGGGGGGGGSTQGKHLLPVMAGAITPNTATPCGTLVQATPGGTDNYAGVLYLPFDATTAEYADFAISMPESWNEGTVTFKVVWKHPSTTTNFGVAWNLAAVAMGDGDDLAATTLGTPVVVTDTGAATDRLYITAESSAVTIAGTPAAGDTVFFRIGRVPTDGGDTLAVDAHLIGVRLYYTTNADTD